MMTWNSEKKENEIIEEKMENVFITICSMKLRCPFEK